MQSLKSIGQFYKNSRKELTVTDGQTDKRTDPNYRKASSIIKSQYIKKYVNRREFPNVVASECATENVLDDPGRNFDFVPQHLDEIFCDSGFQLKFLEYKLKFH